MKVIDILNKIANGELKNNTKFKIIPEDGEKFICKYSSSYPGYIWVINHDKEISFNYKIDHMRILSYEVEIIEEIDDIKINKERIGKLTYKGEQIGFGSTEKFTDEIDDYCTAINNILDIFGIKINEIIDKINKLNKEG